MHAEKLLHKFFGKSCQIDKRILRTLFEAVESVTRGRKLSIFGIARTLIRPSKVKHLIKCIDRLFGNKNLHNERQQLYQAMINQIIRCIPRPVIIIDWSGLTHCGVYCFLRASIAVKGRTLTLYEQSYRTKKQTSYKAHKEFLEILKELLPENCCPIIVTDAGFRNSWFRLVESFGWDYIGRVRNLTKCRNTDSKVWKPIKKLYCLATSKAKFLGSFWLSKSSSLFCYLYLLKQKRLYRERRNLAGKKIQSSASLKHAKRENEPWLIASSLGPESIFAKELMMIYKKRMQIEESFRDLKNNKNGFSLRQCRSTGEERLNIALLIGSLAAFVLWLIGMATKQKNLHYGFQSNTIRDRDVLSVVSIGWQALERRMRFTWLEIQQALKEVVLCATN